jgi:hypothetical protein
MSFFGNNMQPIPIINLSVPFKIEYCGPGSFLVSCVICGKRPDTGYWISYQTTWNGITPCATYNNSAPVCSESCMNLYIFNVI